MENLRARAGCARPGAFIPRHTTSLTHLDLLSVVRHDDTPQARELGVDLRVINRPKAVELHDALVPLDDRQHALVGHVSHDL